MAGVMALFLGLMTAAGCSRVADSRLLGTWSFDWGKTPVTDAMRDAVFPRITFESDGTFVSESLRGDDAQSAKTHRDERRWELVLDRGDRTVIRITKAKSQTVWLVTCFFADDDHLELVEREGFPGLKYERAE